MYLFLLQVQNSVVWESCEKYECFGVVEPVLQQTFPLFIGTVLKNGKYITSFTYQKYWFIIPELQELINCSNKTKIMHSAKVSS